MHDRMRSGNSAFVIGVVAMLAGAMFIWASLLWKNMGAGQAGSGIWALGSVGMGMLMGMRRRSPVWYCEYAHLLIFAPPAVLLAWLYSASANFPPLLALDACSLLAPAVFGFWFGLATGLGTNEAALARGRFNGGIWLVVLLLQVAVVGMPIWLAFPKIINGYVFWFELFCMLWFPIGAAICSAVPWAWIVGLERPKHFGTWPVCVIGWLFLLAFVVMLTLGH